MIYFILTFFLGSAVGSFVNVLIDRTMLGQDWVKGHSHCDHCRQTLAWYDMIPVVSFLLYRGKSRCCGTALPYRHLAVEILAGVLFLWWLGVGFVFFRLVVAPLSVIQPLFWLVSGVVLLILALADLFYGVVLLPIVWIGSTAVILYRVTLWYFGAYQGVDFLHSLLVATGFFGFFWALHKLTKGKGMAEGDMYVALYMGVLLGWPRGMVALVASFILGALVGICLIVTGIRGRKETVPFVPFMVAGMILALIWGEAIGRWIF